MNICDDCCEEFRLIVNHHHFPKGHPRRNEVVVNLCHECHHKLHNLTLFLIKCKIVEDVLTWWVKTNQDRFCGLNELLFQLEILGYEEMKKELRDWEDKWDYELPSIAPPGWMEKWEVEKNMVGFPMPLLIVKPWKWLWEGYIEGAVLERLL